MVFGPYVGRCKIGQLNAQNGRVLLVSAKAQRIPRKLQHTKKPAPGGLKTANAPCLAAVFVFVGVCCLGKSKRKPLRGVKGKAKGPPLGSPVGIPKKTSHPSRTIPCKGPGFPPDAEVLFLGAVTLPPDPGLKRHKGHQKFSSARVYSAVCRSKSWKQYLTRAIWGQRNGRTDHRTIFVYLLFFVFTWPWQRERDAIWLWIKKIHLAVDQKNRCPKWIPGKSKAGQKPVVPW